MTAKRDTPAPRPGVSVGGSASEADTEEGTEERTIEFDVDAMSEELMDAIGGADDGAVAKPVETRARAPLHRRS